MENNHFKASVVGGNGGIMIINHKMVTCMDELVLVSTD
jgi:hypothetical protein